MNKDKLEKAMANARASLEMEGMEVTEKETELIRKHLTGDISEKELLKYLEKDEKIIIGGFEREEEYK